MTIRFWRFASGILGEQMVLDQFASDTPYKGSVHQDVHGDLQALYPELPDVILPPHFLGVNWPFIDVTPRTGPISDGRRDAPAAEGRGASPY